MPELKVKEVIEIKVLLIGASLTQRNVYKGERWSAAKAFLRPAMARSNLHVATKAHVTKVTMFINKFLTDDFFYLDINLLVY